MHKIEELTIWKKGIELVKVVYELINVLPETEKFGLTSQIKRCAISIPSNIAEGAGRNSEKEFIRFLAIANGSSYELQTQLLLLKELALIDNSRITEVMKKIIEIQKMNYAFQEALRKRL